MVAVDTLMVMDTLMVVALMTMWKRYGVDTVMMREFARADEWKEVQQRDRRERLARRLAIPVGQRCHQAQHWSVWRIRQPSHATSPANCLPARLTIGVPSHVRITDAKQTRVIAHTIGT